MTYWAQLHGLTMMHRSGRIAMPRTAFIALGLRFTNYLLEGYRA